jgi:hypothetical protein
LKRGEQQSVPTNVNDLITSTLALLHSEFVDRRIKVQTDWMRPCLRSWAIPSNCSRSFSI